MGSQVQCYTRLVYSCAMANLTITVDEETLKRARIRAIEEGESVNRFLARQLARYARTDQDADRRRENAKRFVQLSKEAAGSSEGRGWTREQLWEDALQ